MMVRVIAPAAFVLALSGMAASAATTSGARPAHNPPVSSGQSSATSQQTHPTTINIVAASQIVGRNLQDPGGADAGTIQSLVIDTRTGIVDFVIVGSSGSFNTNGSVIAVPWLALQAPTSGSGPITTKISVDKILHSPQINPARVNQLNQPAQRARIYGYYGYPYPRYYRNGYGNGWGAGLAGGYGPGAVAGNGPFAGSGQRVPANSAPQPTQATKPQQTNAQQTNTQHANGQQANRQQAGRNGALVVSRNAVISTLNQRQTTSANALQSATVYGQSGQSIGDIDQVMIDANRGEVAFILLSRGGFLGLNQRWYALPIEALLPAPYQGGYRLTVNEESLLGEPQFNVDRQNLPTRVSASQLASLYGRFGMEPYWEQNKPNTNPVSASNKTDNQPSGGQSVGQPASK